MRTHATIAIAVAVSALAAVVPAQGERKDAAVDASLYARLATARIGRVEFTAERGALLDVVALLRHVTGLPILVTAAARRLAVETGSAFVGELRAPIAVADFLDLLLAPTPELAWTVRHGVIEITIATALPTRTRLRLHDVRDLVFARTEFLPPVIDGIPDGSARRRSGGEGEARQPAHTADELILLIKTADPAAWQTDGATIESLDSGYLLVVAPPATQRAVAQLLAQLR